MRLLTLMSSNSSWSNCSRVLYCCCRVVLSLLFAVASVPACDQLRVRAPIQSGLFSDQPLLSFVLFSQLYELAASGVRERARLRQELSEMQQEMQGTKRSCLSQLQI